MTPGPLPPYGIGVHVPIGPERALELTRAALQAEGFGVLTEIDVRATLKAKLDVDIAPYVILGACNPSLAHRALVAEPDIGLLLPCNVVVYGQRGGTRVAALDPAVQLGVTGSDALLPVAQDARERLTRAMMAVARNAVSFTEEVV